MVKGEVWDLIKFCSLHGLDDNNNSWEQILNSLAGGVSYQTQTLELKTKK